MTLLSLDELIFSTNGSLVLPCDFIGFDSVCTDSREVCKKSLFVPLLGENQDGHFYIPQAIKNGASAIFVSRVDDEIKKIASENKSTAFIFVQNTMHALGFERKNHDERIFERDAFSKIQCRFHKRKFEF